MRESVSISSKMPEGWTIGDVPSDVRGFGSFDAIHEHKWQGVAFERRAVNMPGDVIQSCPCGDVRRVEVPE